MLEGLGRLGLVLLMIAGLLGAGLLGLYLAWYAVMLAVSYLPLVGKRHRHDRWGKHHVDGDSGKDVQEGG